ICFIFSRTSANSSCRFRPRRGCPRRYHDAFGRAGRLLHGAEGRDKDGDLAVLDAADANARPDARVILRVRLMIGYVKDIVAVDVDPARPAELLPLCEEFAILVEDLHAIVA